jgi:hypothetical protein
MELTSFQNSVEVYVLLALHIVYVYPLMFHRWSSLPVEHGVVPILVKESLEPLIGAPLFG